MNPDSNNYINDESIQFDSDKNENYQYMIRNEIFDNLGIKSVYPCSLLTNQASVVCSRCILEYNPTSDGMDITTSTRFTERQYEDIIIRFKENKTIHFSGDISITTGKVIQELLTILYRPNSIIFRQAFLSPSPSSSSSSPFRYYLQPRMKFNAYHPGINSTFLYVESKPTSKNIFICQEYWKHSMLSLSRFHAKTTLTSPTLARGNGTGPKDIRLRFVMYQLLQVLAYIHSKDIVLDELNPSNIYLNDNLWLFLPISLSNRTCSSVTILSKTNISRSDIISLENQFKIPRPLDHDIPVTTQWLEGKISNFEYLMRVNHAAGRTMIDPLYHPIMPWVTDFTISIIDSTSSSSSDIPSILKLEKNDQNLYSENEISSLGLRNLSKTKFRLSKGDQQLQTTFRHSDPPHHIPESLSELTYYIYLARRTPLQVLRRVVRDVFVPEHYPLSIARMYEWTPDECIPEFYMDPTVFESIHKNLNLFDLELPTFISSASEFISYHRRILESDMVSQNIHRWLDLTFGYCLFGNDAIVNMNVPLRQTLSTNERLGENPSLEKHPGFCILFQEPHPKRKIFGYSNSSRNIKERNISMNSLKYNNTTNRESNNRRISLGRDMNRNGSEVGVGNRIRSDLTAFLDIDMKTTNSKSRRKYEKKMNLIENTSDQSMSSSLSASSSSSSSSSFSNTMQSIINSTNTTTISSRGYIGHQPRLQSLNIAYDTHNSWIALELAEDIDIRNEYSCEESLLRHQEYSRNYLFGENYRSLLAPTYRITNDIEHDHSIDTFDNFIDKDENSSIKVWDHEFARSIDDHRIKCSQINNYNTIEPSAMNYIKQLINEDMFAVGCIIGELYLGKPLLNHKDVQAIKFFSQKPETYHMAISKIMRIVYPTKNNNRHSNINSNNFHGKDSSRNHSLSNGQDVKQQYHQQQSDANSFMTTGGDSDDIMYKPTISNSIDQNNDHPIPLPICRLITLLLQPDISLRPSAAEILQACTMYDIDSWTKKDVGLLRTGGSKPGYVHFHPSPLNSNNNNNGNNSNNSNNNNDNNDNNNDNNNSNNSNNIDESVVPTHRLELMDSYCSSIFPSYFRLVYKFIGSLNLCSNGLNRFQFIIQSLNDILTLHLEGLSIALPHILDIIGDSSPFKISSQTSNAILLNYASIIDVNGLRLGMNTTEKLIIPKVFEFLNTLNSPNALGVLLSSSSFWHTLIIRGGVRSFLRYFLPLLLTYLSSGTLQNISYGNHFNSPSSSPSSSGGSYGSGNNGNQSIGGISPLWATMGITDKSEWLHLCKKSELKFIQEMAVLAISTLVEPAGLGPGLTARFVIPPLMSLIGNPQFSLARYNMFDQQSTEVRNDWDNLRTIAYNHHIAYETDNTLNTKTMAMESEIKLEQYLQSYASKNTQDTYTVHAIVSLCSHLGELVISELVLSRICDEILPLLEPLYAIPIPAASTVSSLMEIVLLLNGILPNLSPSIVCKYYLQSRSSSYSLPELLTTLSIANLWSISDDLSSGHEICDLDIYLESDRRVSLFFELIRLIVSSSMIVGSNACIEYVLPAVDKFFGNFVQVFGKLPIQSKLLLKAFELGAELYLPLENFTGGAFSASVPNLNPRLEVWLSCIGSGSEKRTSPPLPSNILPEIIVDHSSHENKKKKGIFSGWMSSSSSSSTSNTSNLSSSSLLQTSSNNNNSNSKSLNSGTTSVPSTSSNSSSYAMLSSIISSNKSSVSSFQSTDKINSITQHNVTVSTRKSLSSDGTDILHRKSGVDRIYLDSRPSFFNKDDGGEDLNIFQSILSPQVNYSSDYNIKIIIEANSENSEFSPVTQNVMTTAALSTTNRSSYMSRTSFPKQRLEKVDDAEQPSSNHSTTEGMELRAIEKHTDQNNTISPITGRSLDLNGRISPDSPIRILLHKKNLRNNRTNRIVSYQDTEDSDSDDDGDDDDIVEEVIDSPTEEENNEEGEEEGGEGEIDAATSNEIQIESTSEDEYLSTKESYDAMDNNSPKKMNEKVNKISTKNMVLDDMEEEQVSHDVIPTNETTEVLSLSSTTARITRIGKEFVASQTDSSISISFPLPTISRSTSQPTSRNISRSTSRQLSRRNSKDLLLDKQSESSETRSTLLTENLNTDTTIIETVVDPSKFLRDLLTGYQSPKQQLSNRNRVSSFNSVHPNPVTTKRKSVIGNVHLHGHRSSTNKRRNSDNDIDVDDDPKESYYSDASWLLAGYGKWNNHHNSISSSSDNSSGLGGGNSNNSNNSNTNTTSLSYSYSLKGSQGPISLNAMSVGSSSSFTSSFIHSSSNNNNNNSNSNSNNSNSTSNSSSNSNHYMLNTTFLSSSTASIPSVPGTSVTTHHPSAVASVSASIKARASKIVYATSNAFGGMSNMNAPSAQISMTSPRIAVDAAAEAGSLFALSMTVNTQFKADHTKDNLSNSTNGNVISGAIRCLATNPTESILVSCSKSGTKLWSLNSHPITQVAHYHNSGATTIPYSISFLRSGSFLATCDGSINIWDIETSRVVSFIGYSPIQSPFYSMTGVSSRYGVNPGIQSLGDDQLLTSSNNFTLSHYDFRSQSRMNNLKAISEWQLPSLPSLPISQISAFASSSQSNDAMTNHITCAISHEFYALAGSNHGGLWIVDRRMGKTLSSWQGHDSSIVKIAALDDHHFLSVAERSAYVWEYYSGDPIKVFTVKNMPEATSTPLTGSTTIVTAFESSYGGSNHTFLPSETRTLQQVHVIYGIAGHKMYAGRIKGSLQDTTMNSSAMWSSTGTPMDMSQINQRPSHSMGSYREAIDMNEVKLAQTYFTDRNKNKIAKQKLYTTSAVLLPLRRLLLIGSEDGNIQVVS